MRGISNQFDGIAGEQNLAIKEFFTLITEDYVKQLETVLSQRRDIRSLLSSQSLPTHTDDTNTNRYAQLKNVLKKAAGRIETSTQALPTDSKSQAAHFGGFLREVELLKYGNAKTHEFMGYLCTRNPQGLSSEALVDEETVTEKINNLIWAKLSPTWDLNDLFSSVDVKDGVLTLQTNELDLELSIFYNKELRIYEWVVLSLEPKLPNISEKQKFELMAHLNGILHDIYQTHREYEYYFIHYIFYAIKLYYSKKLLESFQAQVKANSSVSLVAEDPRGVSMRLVLWKDSLAVANLFNQQITISLVVNEFSMEEFVQNLSLAMFEGIGHFDIIKLSVNPGLYPSSTVRMLTSESRGFDFSKGFRIATKELSLKLQQVRVDLDDIINPVKALAKFMIHYHLLRKLARFESQFKAESTTVTPRKEENEYGIDNFININFRFKSLALEIDTETGELIVKAKKTDNIFNSSLVRILIPDYIRQNLLSNEPAEFARKIKQILLINVIREECAMYDLNFTANGAQLSITFRKRLRASDKPAVPNTNESDHEIRFTLNCIPQTPTINLVKDFLYEISSNSLANYLPNPVKFTYQQLEEFLELKPIAGTIMIEELKEFARSLQKMANLLCAKFEFVKRYHTAQKVQEPVQNEFGPYKEPKTLFETNLNKLPPLKNMKSIRLKFTTDNMLFVHTKMTPETKHLSKYFQISSGKKFLLPARSDDVSEDRIVISTNQWSWVFYVFIAQYSSVLLACMSQLITKEDETRAGSFVDYSNHANTKVQLVISTTDSQQNRSFEINVNFLCDQFNSPFQVRSLPCIPIPMEKNLYFFKNVSYEFIYIMQQVPEYRRRFSSCDYLDFLMISANVAKGKIVTKGKGFSFYVGKLDAAEYYLKDVFDSPQNFEQLKKVFENLRTTLKINPIYQYGCVEIKLADNSIGDKLAMFEIIIFEILKYFSSSLSLMYEKI